MTGVLVPTGLIALGMAAIGVHLLVRPALRPLERLAAEAARIATTADAEGRIQGRYGRDEVGALADSVDSMLASLGEAHRVARHNTDRLRDFLADVSHELRAPLAHVTSTIDLLERGMVEPDEYDRLLADMQAEVARMARIVSQLLLMARSDEDARAADRPLLLFDLLTDIGRRWAASTALAIDFTGLGSIRDVVVHGNADQIQQLFDVLVDNATRYTPAGGSIELTGAIDRDEVEVAVTDTGIGIAPESLPKVFDRFYRGPDGGTGLGLAIARHIAEAHRGRIAVTSEPGRGTTFTVTLPVIAFSRLVSPAGARGDRTAGRP